MFNSLKKWVQDKAVDLTPPLQPSPSSSSSLSSHTAQNYYYPPTLSYEQKYHERLSAAPSFMSPSSLSRPISMDSVRSSKMIGTTSSVPPSLPSPVELDLSHLNREEQEHIANVLQRARAVDEQHTTISPAVVHNKQSPSASTISPSLSPSASSSSSTSTSGFNSEKPEKCDRNDRYDQHDDNELHEDEELPTSSSPESTLLTIHRCQLCNKEQQQQQQQQEGHSTICLQCQADEEMAQITQNNTIHLIPIGKSASPLPMESNNHEEDQIYDNVMRIEQELIKGTAPFEDDAFLLTDSYTEEINDNQGQEENQRRLSPPNAQSQIPHTSSLHKTQPTNLTEIDEDDFFYQGPSPYLTAAMDSNPIAERIEELVLPSYRIDEYVDEDDTDERDHVKELEETIANISRHFPVPSEQINETELNPKGTILHQPSSLSVGKIDIDSILEMEIESPSTDEQYPQSSVSTHLPTISSQPPLNIPIAVPIAVTNSRGSLSRSSGVRENLTDLLTPTTESHLTNNRPLQRTSSIHSKRVIPIHRQKRNLPSVPTMINHLQLRRANSESRFSLPAVPVPTMICNSNVDDESDLLEIDMNDPTGSMNRTARSKTESEIRNSNDTNSRRTYQSPSVDEFLSTRKQIKQSRDQTTNTPPISSLNTPIKTKKKLKKKTSSPPINSNAHQTNGQTTPTRMTPPTVVLSSSSTPTANVNRPKLQKSTSTEISYPFPISKLILSRDNLNPSRRDGTDLGLQITGGHSLSNCMEVTACIEHIDTRHRNHNILKNALEEGDEVLEVGGVSLRGKSALFVQNLMNSIENEFEIVVRSQHTVPPTSPPVEIHKPEKTNPIIQTQHHLPVSSLTVDPNIQRRHSMDTSHLSPNHSVNNTVVKSQTTIMPLPLINSSNPPEQLLSPTIVRKKSVSSKERLFSIESLHQLSSIKSAEHLIKVATQSNDTSHPSARSATTLAVTRSEKKISNEDLTSLSQPLQRRRIYDQRNSLLPNDPGLNGVGSNQSIERRSSNESDESDNLSQYFRSPSSRKSSLINPVDLLNNINLGLSHERTQSITPIDTETENDASLRLQKFLKSNDEKRLSTGSTGAESVKLSKTSEGKLSGLGSFKFLKKKTKSVDSPNQPNENEYVGDIELQIGHNSEREQLVVRIIKAKNLPPKDTNGYSDPFVKVYLLPGRDQENKRRTKHISKNLNPVWEHTVIYGNMHREELQYKMLEFTVWDYDRFKANDFIGQVTIDLKEANVIDDKAHWYRLQALRSREEATNRGSSPRLFQMTSVDSPAASTSTLNKTTIDMQSRVNPRK